MVSCHTSCPITIAASQDKGWKRCGLLNGRTQMRSRCCTNCYHHLSWGRRGQKGKFSSENCDSRKAVHSIESHAIEQGKYMHGFNGRKEHRRRPLGSRSCFVQLFKCWFRTNTICKLSHAHDCKIEVVLTAELFLYYQVLRPRQCFVANI